MRTTRCQFIATLVSVFIVSSSQEKDPSGFRDFFRTNLEEFDNKPLTFSHPVPSWLKGKLIRNGGARYEVGARSFTHAFDALAKLHSFTFHGNGTVSMSARFLRTTYFNESIAANTIAPYAQFGPLNPRFDMIEKMEAIANQIDNLNVNIYRVRNAKGGNFEYMTVNDVWEVYQVSDCSLKTLKLISPPTSLKTHLYLPILSSAHPVQEFGRQTYLTFLMSVPELPFLKSFVTLYRMSSIGDREQIVTWYLEAPTYMHSFSVTKNYAVFIGQPVSINLWKMFSKGNIVEAMEYRYNDPTYIYVVHLRSKKITTLKYDKFVSYFHHINAYEHRKHKIVVDICTQNSSNMHTMEMPYIRSPTLRNKVPLYYGIKRFAIDLKTPYVDARSFKPSKIVPYSNNLDMPAINENYRHVKYCFAYGLVVKADHVNYDKWALVKKDVCEHGGDLSWIIDNHYPSEPWFVPTLNGKKEDDGILMTHVFDGIRKESYLVLINAVTMKTISKANLPTNVPFSTHGRFFPDE
ncbi:beta,beta-carotene 15,15'-dioxygenase-like [Mytilus galloprovincialis]|uniref:beta,beta-carotene 15,15'-dioxygenase-like n=1 Tax=Mytilus galloprovincialis TaxID=29158 RepID=UPI003F7C4293